MPPFVPSSSCSRQEGDLRDLAIPKREVMQCTSDLGELTHDESHTGRIMGNVADCQLLADTMTGQNQAVDRHPPTVVLHLLLLDIDL